MTDLCMLTLSFLVTISCFYLINILWTNHNCSLNGHLLLAGCIVVHYFYFVLIPQIMKTLYKISSEETGTVVIRRRKIAKALRRWLRENGIPCNHTFYMNWFYRLSFTKKNIKYLCLQISVSLYSQEITLFCWFIEGGFFKSPPFHWKCFQNKILPPVSSELTKFDYSVCWIKTDCLRGVFHD